MSKACVCGNKYLHDFSIKYNSNVHIIPTAIDTKKFSPKEEKIHSVLTIGWTGTSGNYQFFTKKLIDQINHLLTKNHDIIFLFICDHKPDERFNFPYNFIKWNEETEVTDLKKIDIGLMPLKDSAWSKGKCGFKLIQYGAIGIPSIASDVGVNSDVIIDKKTGFIVTDDNWFTPLETLINAPELCRKMGEGAAQHICNNYSLDANYEKLLRVINSVIDE